MPRGRARARARGGGMGRRRGRRMGPRGPGRGGPGRRGPGPRGRRGGPGARMLPAGGPARGRGRRRRGRRRGRRRRRHHKHLHLIPRWYPYYGYWDARYEQIPTLPETCCVDLHLKLLRCDDNDLDGIHVNVYETSQYNGGTWALVDAPPQPLAPSGFNAAWVLICNLSAPLYPGMRGLKTRRYLG